MITSAKDDLSRFHEFVGTLLNQSPTATPEEAIDAWFAMHPETDEVSHAAIRQGLAEMAAGEEGLSLQEAVAQLRARVGIRA